MNPVFFATTKRWTRRPNEQRAGRKSGKNEGEGEEEEEREGGGGGGVGDASCVKMRGR